MPLFGRRKKPGKVLVRYSSPEKVPATRSPIKREVETLRRESGALTAAGMRINHGQASYIRRLVQPWQIRSYGYYDIVPEIKYAGQFYSRALAELQLYAAEWDDENNEWVETDNPQVKAALDRIKDPGGTTRQGLLSSYGRLMFLAGEALLLVTLNETLGTEQWEMLSTDELRVLDGSVTRFSAPTLPAMNFAEAPDDAYTPIVNPEDPSGPTQAIVYRLWKRHPRFSMLPDATMEAVLEIAEELVLLTQAVRARARSRLAGSGVLFIDDEITITPNEPSPDEDPQEDNFMADLTEAMTNPIINEGTAGAVVPLITRISVPEGKKLEDVVYHLKIIDPMEVYPETGLRMECIKRLAIGLDMPPEVLLGMTDANHWTAWQIDEQSWKAHLQPVAEQLVSDLTTAYLTPYLISQGVTDWQKYAIAYDATKVINHPDRGKDAKDLYDRRAISKKALREATGFNEDDAPPIDELAEMVGVATHDASLAWEGTPAPRGGAVEIAPGVISSDQPGDQKSPTTPEVGAEVEKGPATTPQTPTAETVVGAARIAGVATAMLIRSRESAGSKLRSKVRRDADTSAELDGVRGEDVAAKLGKTRVRALGVSDTTLTASVKPLMAAALRSVGAPESVIEEISNTIERHAIRTLYDLKPQPLPPTFQTYVEGLLTGAAESDG